MKRLLILSAALLMLTNSLKGQGELDEQQRLLLRNEKSFGVQLNADGLGFGYRIANRVDFRNKNTFEFELGTMKHPREYKYNVYDGSSVVYGKINFPMYFRGSIGRQRELYTKADLGGVSVRFLYSAGPTLAVYKPIYYRLVDFASYIPGAREIPLIDVKFNPDIVAAWEIYGRSSFFKGISETRVIPGVFGRTGFAFEYSKEDRIIHAIEVGASLNAYLKEIPIMASNDNRFLFLSLFVSYRFGIVVNPLDPESGRIRNLFRSN